MENQVIKVLKERRSVKNYSGKQIDEETLNKILEAGTFAANGRGLQSAVMVVVQDNATREKLRSMNAEILGNPNMDPFYNAPTIIVVLADKNVPTYVEDGSLVIGNLMNAAYSLGVDSCWIHRAKEEFESDEGKALLKEWGLSDRYVGVGHCILGYGQGTYPKPKQRKSDYIIRV